MAVPYPVDIEAGQIAAGFKGTLQDLLNTFADNLTATVGATFISGQLGGTTPTQNVGPWANGGEWWFWDPVSQAYHPSEQGVPVGTIAIWGGQGVPVNWLLCDGRAVDRILYKRLFTVIGGTWGAGDGSSTFNLPPPAKFYVNAPGWVGDATVPVDAGYSNTGVNARGGQQKATLADRNIPALQVTIPWLNPSFQETPGYGVPNIQPPGSQPGNATTYPVTDSGGGALGVNQAPVPTVPPYVAANFIIKYQ
jgi:microcystin-dependent protein